VGTLSTWITQNHIRRFSAIIESKNRDKVFRYRTWFIFNQNRIRLFIASGCKFYALCLHKALKKNMKAKAFDTRLFKRILKFTKPYKWRFNGVIIFISLSIFAALRPY
jgi:hypothetical protein